MPDEPRECRNCRAEKVDESKQTFVYRDWLGNNWDACIRPVCDKCIAAGYYVEEGGMKPKLYLGTSRRYVEPPDPNRPW